VAGAAAMAWIKIDIAPHSERLEGDSRVKQMHTNITSVSKIVEMFIGNGFLICCINILTCIIIRIQISSYPLQNTEVVRYQFFRNKKM
jgi:hypothetical protein